MSKIRRQATCHPERIEAAKGLCWGCYQPNTYRPKRRNLPHNPEKDITLSPPVEGVLQIDDLIRLVADLNQTSYIEGKKTVYAFFSAIIKALRNKEKVRVMGFGTWRVIVTKPSPRINIYTKVREMGKPRVFVHFKFDHGFKKELKECILNIPMSSEP